MNNMKTGFLIAVSFATTLLIGCNKSESGNKNVIQTDGTTIADNTAQTHRTSIYKAEDGTLVKVVFTEGSKENTLAITSNKKTFTLSKTRTTKNGSLYQKDDMKAEIKGDSLILDQGNNIIQLVKTKIE